MPEKRPSVAFFVTVIIVVVLLLPVLYLALTGPVMFLNAAGVMSDAALQTVYAPLSITQDWVPEWFVEWWDDYTSWWAGLADSTAEIRG
jgi:hypothetical protein